MDRLGSFLPGLHAELQRLDNVGSKMKHDTMRLQDGGEGCSIRMKIIDESIDLFSFSALE